MTSKRVGQVLSTQHKIFDMLMKYSVLHGLENVKNICCIRSARKVTVNLFLGINIFGQKHVQNEVSTGLRVILRTLVFGKVVDEV